MNANQLLPDLHWRIVNMQDDFKGFVRSECGLSYSQCFILVKNPEICTPEQRKKILKVAEALAIDLLALIKRYKKVMKRRE